MKRSFTGCAVTEETDRHGVTAFQLGGDASAGGDRQSSPDNAIGAEHARVEIGDVHRATLALAVAGPPAEQLGHHAFHVGAFGDAVAAVVAHDAIGDSQVGADANRDRLLAAVWVHDAVDPVLQAEPQR